MTLDEIYESFLWDASYTPQEYEEKCAAGIAAARQYKYLQPFIQPILPNKPIWEPCARVIAERTDEELQPYLYVLFEWLQDLNWPGADIIFDRLSQMPFSMLEEAYLFSRKCAEDEKDMLWLMALDDFGKQINRENDHNV